MKIYKTFLKLSSALNVKFSYLFFLVVLMLFASIIDLLSIGLIAPYVSKILELDFTNDSFFSFINLNFLEIKEENLIFSLTILLILLFLAKSILSIFLRWLIADFCYNQYAKLQLKLMSNYQKMDYEDFIFRSTGQYIRNVRELCSDCLSYLEACLRFLSEAVIMLVILSFLLSLDLKVMIFLLLIITPVFLLYELILKPINFNLGKLKDKATIGTYRNIDTSLRSLKEIRILSKENFFLNKLDHFNNIVFNSQRKSVLITDSPRYVFEFVVIASALSLLLYLTGRNIDLNMYIPILSIYIFAALRLLPSISIMTSSLSRITYCQFSVDRVLDDLINLSLDKKIIKNKIETKKEIFNNLNFKNVFFKYKNSELNVLENINFNIDKNECIGIMGKSGSGKTTLIDLMLGILIPQKGEILINGKKVKNTSENFIANSSYLPQDPIILDETIKTNISLETSNDKINFEKLNTSIRKSNLIEFVNRLPEKIETKIGEYGVRLSGGQNKRLALSRAFYHGKDVIIMDEATSSLDVETESVISEEIKNIKGKITIVIISHSKNILKYCDKIYELKNHRLILN